MYIIKINCSLLNTNQDREEFNSLRINIIIIFWSAFLLYKIFKIFKINYKLRKFNEEHKNTVVNFERNEIIMMESIIEDALKSSPKIIKELKENPVIHKRKINFCMQNKNK